MYCWHWRKAKNGGGLKKRLDIGIEIDIGEVLEGMV